MDAGFMFISTVRPPVESRFAASSNLGARGVEPGPFAVVRSRSLTLKPAQPG